VRGYLLTSAKQISGLLHTLYSAPTSPALWGQFLHDLSHLAGLPKVAILHQDLANKRYELSVTANIDPEEIRLYAEHYGTIDEWRPRFLTKVEGEIAFGDELSPPNQLRETEFYNDYLTKFDIKLLCAVPLLKREGSFDLISFYESWRVTPRREVDMALIEMVLPHLRSALILRRSVYSTLEKFQELEALLGMLNCGVILFDVHGTCVFVNNEAQRILDQRDGLSLVRGKLSASNASESGMLRALIERAVLTGGGKEALPGGAVLVSRHPGKSLQIVISPFVSERVSTVQRALAIGFISDPDLCPARPERVLQMLYGLTKAECRLAHILTEGHSLSEIAQMKGLTQNTLRSQLKSVFHKTGVRRQSELVRLLSPLLVFTPRLQRTQHKSQ
jgi:DNA-binding CsgD family transcriptional regulator